MNDKTLLFELRERTSASGNRYLSGWLGKASVVAFIDREASEPTWQVYVQTPKPKPDATKAHPFRNRPERKTGKSRPMRPGELDDPLPDFGGGQ